MASETASKHNVSAWHGQTGWLVGLIPGALFVYLLTFIGPVSEGETFRYAYNWIPGLDVQLSFYIDGLGLIFGLIVTGIGTLIMIYGGGYLADDRQLNRFYLYIVSFMLAMVGTVLSDNLISLFVFWELTSVTSYMLIGYYHESPESRKSAWQALLVTGAGGLAMMGGLVLIGIYAGTWELSEMFANNYWMGEHDLYGITLLLICLGAFTKSAQFPFHFWLPGAMAAPTPVSAYLHSATMVKLGIYLLARLHPILGGTTGWLYTLSIFGALTMFLGGYIAWRQTDLKKILAYSTVSALGTLVMLIGIGTPTALEGAIIFLVVHSLYKGTLFMVAGAIDHEAGTRDVRKLGGLRHTMPITGGAAALAALSMSGIPPFYGFLGKEVIYEATLHGHFIEPIMTTVAVFGNAFNIVVACMVTVLPFLGAETDTPKHPHEAPLSMWIGPITLGSLGLIFGALVPIFKDSFGLLPLAPHFVADALVGPGVNAMLNETHEMHLYLWHGFSTPLILSIITVALGVGIFFWRETLYNITRPLDILPRITGPELLYQVTFDEMLNIARWQTAVLQNGYLRYYLLTIMTTTVGLVLATIPLWVTPFNIIRMPDAYLYEYLLVIAVLAATYTSVTATSRLVSVTALGGVGYGVGLFFLLFGAPDLAMTQFSIETLMVILLVLVLYRLPRYKTLTRPPDRVRDAIVALSSGLLMTMFVLLVTGLRSPSRLTPYFAENSYKLAQGHNIVNVILVDFRGVDTMGEITVLAVAALGVYALMNLRLGQEQDVKIRPESTGTFKLGEK